MCGMLGLFQISAGFLNTTARERAENETDPNKKAVAERRADVIFDLYIKANSYGVINKAMFVVSIIFAVAVLVWPLPVAILKSVAACDAWSDPAAGQAMVTGLAAFAYALYSQYKTKQAFVENLMRQVLYSQEEFETLIPKILEEMTKVDMGFSFASLSKKNA